MSGKFPQLHNGSKTAIARNEAQLPTIEIQGRRKINTAIRDDGALVSGLQ
jgi:hypothetical protein